MSEEAIREVAQQIAERLRKDWGHDMRHEAGVRWLARCVAEIAAWNRRAGGEREYTREEMREACQQNYNAGRAAAASEREAWQPIESAPRDRFIWLWCPEDNSRWLAKWQDSQWYGVDDEGLTRACGYHKDSGRVTGWEITHWQPLPAPPRAALSGQTEGRDV